MTNAYDFSFIHPNGEILSLSDFRGHPILVVNTASECGFTKQYAGLQHLYDHYRMAGLVVLAVPSNDFGKQEPGDDQTIQSFCQLHYGISFPVLKKERVCGEHAHPFYLWAKETLGFLSAPKWNFHKYLIDRQGNLIDYFYSTTDPEADRVKKSIEAALEHP